MTNKENNNIKRVSIECTESEIKKLKKDYEHYLKNANNINDTLSFKEWYNKTFEASINERVRIIKENYKNCLESELKALEHEFFINRDNNIFAHNIFRKKLNKINPLPSFSYGVITKDK